MARIAGGPIGGVRRALLLARETTVESRGSGNDRPGDLNQFGNRLGARLHDRRASIAVLGQGYVGLSLACAAAERGFTLVGIDIDEERVAELSSGRLRVPG